MNKICNVCLSNICVNRVISYRIMGVGCNISFPLLEDTNVEVSKANFVVNFSGVIRMSAVVSASTFLYSSRLAPVRYVYGLRTRI